MNNAGREPSDDHSEDDGQAPTPMPTGGKGRGGKGPPRIIPNRGVGRRNQAVDLNFVEQMFGVTAQGGVYSPAAHVALGRATINDAPTRPGRSTRSVRRPRTQDDVARVEWRRPLPGEASVIRHSIGTDGRPGPSTLSWPVSDIVVRSVEPGEDERSELAEADGAAGETTGDAAEPAEVSPERGPPELTPVEAGQTHGGAVEAAGGVADAPERSPEGASPDAATEEADLPSAGPVITAFGRLNDGGPSGQEENEDRELELREGFEYAPGYEPGMGSIKKRRRKRGKKPGRGEEADVIATPSTVSPNIVGGNHLPPTGEVWAVFSQEKPQFCQNSLRD